MRKYPKVIRARYLHETFDCHECGAMVKALEEFEYCSICNNPLHVGCAVWIDGEYICPGCGEKDGG